MFCSSSSARCAHWQSLLNGRRIFRNTVAWGEHRNAGARKRIPTRHPNARAATRHHREPGARDSSDARRGLHRRTRVIRPVKADIGRPWPGTTDRELPCPLLLRQAGGRWRPMRPAAGGGGHDGHISGDGRGRPAGVAGMRPSQPREVGPLGGRALGALGLTRVIRPGGCSSNRHPGVCPRGICRQGARGIDAVPQPHPHRRAQKPNGRQWPSVLAAERRSGLRRDVVALFSRHRR